MKHGFFIFISPFVIQTSGYNDDANCDRQLQLDAHRPGYDRDVCVDFKDSRDISVEKPPGSLGASLHIVHEGENSQTQSQRFGVLTHVSRRR